MSQVLVEAHHNQKPNLYVGVFIIVLSLIVGLLILFLLILMLWKVSATLKTKHCQSVCNEVKNDVRCKSVVSGQGLSLWTTLLI